MGVTLENRRPTEAFSFTLYHEVYCAGGAECACRVDNVMRSVHDGKTGQVGFKYGDVRFPASVHLDPRGRVTGLHAAVKKIPQVADALRTGRLIAKDEVEVKPAPDTKNRP